MDKQLVRILYTALCSTLDKIQVCEMGETQCTIVTIESTLTKAEVPEAMEDMISQDTTFIVKYWSCAERRNGGGSYSDLFRVPSNGTEKTCKGNLCNSATSVYLSVMILIVAVGLLIYFIFLNSTFT